MADLRARPLPSDLPGPGRGCLTSDPDATLRARLDLQQCASVLASADALDVGMELFADAWQCVAR
ncbi:hypothetical protein [Candidatus Mycobacterium methanotrophicum]|uniref:Uncharacterized protein n=1 Tax=Candidatus Mycobacterium methanotrophicum TaxID=2943498 RepID=A0ABY4QKM3_9MYCO|nr:hypothetical protein [Candidatus Mycobacterium methanotrophicum]UQX10225.1 hypothetical protein M5I08_18920 [Candidatus Mycobacterium methanotrophicum]